MCCHGPGKFHPDRVTLLTRHTRHASKARKASLYHRRRRLQPGPAGPFPFLRLTTARKVTEIPFAVLETVKTDSRRACDSSNQERQSGTSLTLSSAPSASKKFQTFRQRTRGELNVAEREIPVYKSFLFWMSSPGVPLQE